MDLYSNHFLVHMVYLFWSIWCIYFSEDNKAVVNFSGVELCLRFEMSECFGWTLTSSSWDPIEAYVR